MSTKLKPKQKFYIVLVGFLVAAFISALAIYASHHNVELLNPAGTVAKQERSLIYFALALSLLIVIPVFGLTFYICVKYRATNKNAKYSPDWDRSRVLESLWWFIPSALIAVLAVVTWRSTYSLDPGKALVSKNPTLQVQVVSLDWKWLFIYPQQHMASLNYLEFPNNTPVSFEITSDAPMNSFWIPQLGGQIYAMPGMSTNLNLMADKIGNFRGSSANISGAGFADMDFLAHSVSANNFNGWVSTVKQSPLKLTNSAYDVLVRPTQNSPSIYYSSVANGLYARILNKYMTSMNGASSMSGMDMSD